MYQSKPLQFSFFLRSFLEETSPKSIPGFCKNTVFNFRTLGWPGKLGKIQIYFSILSIYNIKTIAKISFVKKCVFI